MKPLVIFIYFNVVNGMLVFVKEIVLIKRNVWWHLARFPRCEKTVKLHHFVVFSNEPQPSADAMELAIAFVDILVTFYV